LTETAAFNGTEKRALGFSPGAPRPSRATRGCPVKPSTSQGPDQALHSDLGYRQNLERAEPPDPVTAKRLYLPRMDSSSGMFMIVGLDLETGPEVVISAFQEIGGVPMRRMGRLLTISSDGMKYALQTNRKGSAAAIKKLRRSAGLSRFTRAGCNGAAGLSPEVLGPRGRYLTKLN
jgi:hypothetical protein